MNTKNIMNAVWQTGLYACMHQGVLECVDLTLCCCCELSRQYDATIGFSYSYNIPVLVVSPVCFHLLFFLLRRRVIDKYHIEEDPLLSLCTIACCGFCSTCQVHRELDLRNVPCGLTLPCISRDASVYISMR